MDDAIRALVAHGPLGILAAASLLANWRLFRDLQAAKDAHRVELLALTERLATVTQKSLEAVEAARVESRENQSMLRSVLDSLKSTVWKKP